MASIISAVFILGIWPGKNLPGKKGKGEGKGGEGEGHPGNSLFPGCEEFRI